MFSFLLVIAMLAPQVSPNGMRCGEARELTQGSGTVRVCEVVR